MSNRLEKQKFRRASRRRWLNGRLKNGLPMPTKEEIACFSSGFNMGYSACKRKHVKN